MPKLDEFCEEHILDATFSSPSQSTSRKEVPQLTAEQKTKLTEAARLQDVLEERHPLDPEY